MADINHAAWLRSCLQFIKSKQLEDEFRDFCGGWPTPDLPAPALGEATEVQRLKDHIRCLLDSDPNDDAADAVTVLDVWRKHAIETLHVQPSHTE